MNGGTAPAGGQTLLATIEAAGPDHAGDGGYGEAQPGPAAQVPGTRPATCRAVAGGSVMAAIRLISGPVGSAL
jgi:hypothetical protein